MSDPGWLDDHRPPAPREPRDRPLAEKVEPADLPEIVFPSIHYGLDEAAYHADPAPKPTLSASCAHTICTRSALHAHWEHPRLGGHHRKTTKAMDRGSALDHLLLGGGREFHVVEADSWRKKADQAEKKAAIAEGLHPVLPHELDTYLESAAGIRAAFAKIGVDLSAGRKQVTAFWIELAEDGTEVPCRSRFDILDVGTDVALLSDLKTVESAAEDDVEKAVDQRNHDIQAIAYARSVEANFPDLIGRVQWRWLFAEYKAPYGVRIAKPFGTLRALGEWNWSHAVNTWAQCLETGEWLGYPETPMLVETKPWKLRRAGVELEGF